MFNASEAPVSYRIIPAQEGKRWFRAVDTAMPSPEDIVEAGVEAALAKQEEYLVRELSVVVLVSKVV
jgi:glycogen operon protein